MPSSDSSANCRNCNYEQTQRNIHFTSRLKETAAWKGLQTTTSSVYCLEHKGKGIINKSIVWLSIVPDVHVQIQTIRMRGKANLYSDITKGAIFRGMTRCCLVYFHWLFMRTYFLLLQGLSLPACLAFLFHPEDGGITFVQTIGELQQDYTASHPTSHRCENLRDDCTKIFRSQTKQKHISWWCYATVSLNISGQIQRLRFRLEEATRIHKLMDLGNIRTS